MVIAVQYKLVYFCRRKINNLFLNLAILIGISPLPNLTIS